MSHLSANLASIYLPLLNNTQREVRQQACAIMLGTYGQRSLTHLRRLLNAPDPMTRQQARAALLAVAELTELNVVVEPFEGMHIECMGRLRVFVGSREVQDEIWARADAGKAGWQKVQAVSAYLVHSGRRGASREALIEAVWGGPPGATSLPRSLKTVRDSLGGLFNQTLIAQSLVITSDHCMLAPELYHTDAQLFESAFNTAWRAEEEQGLREAAPLYAQAMQLYGGPYMGDVLRGGIWARERREHLRGSFLITVDRLAEHAFAEGQFAECVALCAQALDGEELAEDLVIWQLRAYRELGHEGELEYAYQRYLRAVGIDPTASDSRHDPVVKAYAELRSKRGPMKSRSYGAST